MIGLIGFVLGAVLVLLVVGLVVTAAVVFGSRATTKVRRNYERSNEVVPGVPTAAPTGWLGSHDPEAKLHRRLADAIRALHTNQSFDTLGTYLDLRVELEQQAVAIDNELVATAALPVHLRTEPLQRLSAEVASIESAVAELARASSTDAAGRIDDVLRQVRERSSTLGQAQAALDELERGGSAPTAGSPTAGSPTPPPVTDPPTPPAAPPAPEA